MLKSTIYYPLLVSNKGTAEPLSKEEDTLIWKKYLSITQQNRAIVASYELPRKVKELEDRYKLSESAVGQISLSIRKIFFGELDMVACETVITSALTQAGGDASKTKEIVQFIDKEILHLVPKTPLEVGEIIEKDAPSIKQLALLKAISEYPRLNDQLVTNEKIKLKGQSELQRPSLSNWIHYYRDELGVGFHDQVTRGRFLFQSENGKRLNNEERERINLVLKSIEEDFPLDIDAEHMAIVFPTRASAAAAPQAAARPLFPPREGVTPARSVKPFQSNIPPTGLPVVSGVPVAQPSPAKQSFFANKLSPAKNVAGETLHFSTGHVLPGEKNTDGAATKVATSSSSQTMTTQPNLASGFRPNSINQNRGTALPRSPYSIRPLRMRSDTREEGE